MTSVTVSCVLGGPGYEPLATQLDVDTTGTDASASALARSPLEVVPQPMTTASTPPTYPAGFQFRRTGGNTETSTGAERRKTLSGSFHAIKVHRSVERIQTRSSEC
jgi:hypothetical protein